MRPLVLAIVLGFQLQKQLRLMSPPSQDPGAFGYDSSGVSELRTAFLMLYEPCSWCNCCVALLSHHHETDRERERERQRESVKREASSPKVTPPDGGGRPDTRGTRARGSQRNTMAVGAGGQALGQKSKRGAPGTKAQRTCGGAAAKTPQPAGGTKAQRA